MTKQPNFNALVLLVFMQAQFEASLQKIRAKQLELLKKIEKKAASQVQS